MQDPDLETEEQRAERLAREALSDEGAEELKAADVLKHYLRNKVVSSLDVRFGLDKLFGLKVGYLTSPTCSTYTHLMPS